eukprot:635736_1
MIHGCGISDFATKSETSDIEVVNDVERNSPIKNTPAEKCMIVIAALILTALFTGLSEFVLRYRYQNENNLYVPTFPAKADVLSSDTKDTALNRSDYIEDNLFRSISDSPTCNTADCHIRNAEVFQPTPCPYSTESKNEEASSEIESTETKTYTTFAYYTLQFSGHAGHSETPTASSTLCLTPLVIPPNDSFPVIIRSHPLTYNTGSGNLSVGIRQKYSKIPRDTKSAPTTPDMFLGKRRKSSGKYRNNRNFQDFRSNRLNRNHSTRCFTCSKETNRKCSRCEQDCFCSEQCQNNHEDHQNCRKFTANTSRSVVLFKWLEFNPGLRLRHRYEYKLTCDGQGNSQDKQSASISNLKCTSSNLYLLRGTKYKCLVTIYDYISNRTSHTSMVCSKRVTVRNDDQRNGQVQQERFDIPWRMVPVHPTPAEEDISVLDFVKIDNELYNMY